MAISELLTAFETEANDVVSANEAKATAQASLVAAQELVAQANTALATEKTEARTALDALITALNEMAEQLGI